LPFPHFPACLFRLAVAFSVPQFQALLFQWIALFVVVFFQPLKAHLPLLPVPFVSFRFLAFGHQFLPVPRLAFLQVPPVPALCVPVPASLPPLGLCYRLGLCQRLLVSLLLVVR
jgi:hypothetical protein